MIRLVLGMNLQFCPLSSIDVLYRWSSAREIATGDVAIIWPVRPVNNNDDLYIVLYTKDVINSGKNFNSKFGNFGQADSVGISYGSKVSSRSGKGFIHITIPCDIPRYLCDLKVSWYRILQKILPPHWSCDWMNYLRTYLFLQTMADMGDYDLDLMISFEVVHHVKYRPREPDSSGSYSYGVDGNVYDQSIVLQNGLGD